MHAANIMSPMAPPSASSSPQNTPSHKNTNNNHNNSGSGSVGKKELGDVILELRGVEKSFRVDGSDEAVVALKGIHLCGTGGSVGEGGNHSHRPPVPMQREAQTPPLPSSSSENGVSRQSSEHTTTTTSTPNNNNNNSRIEAFGAVRQGEFVMIRGPSGGGKTTLLNLIGTLDSPTNGEITLLGKKIDRTTDDGVLADIRLRHLGFVFQTFNLIATMTAAENVELPMTLVGDLNAKQRRLRARQLLSLVGLRNRIDHLPSELSGGEQQRVTIARSLANNPKILLLDEPTGDLDTATTLEVMDLLLRLNYFTKTTCIMVTHNPDVECYADRILYVSDGQFLREVVNAEPRQLVLEKYVQYLAEREKMMTTATARREV